MTSLYTRQLLHAPAWLEQMCPLAQRRKLNGQRFSFVFKHLFISSTTLKTAYTYLLWAIVSASGRFIWHHLMCKDRLLLSCQHGSVYPSQPQHKLRPQKNRMARIDMGYLSMPALLRHHPAYNSYCSCSCATGKTWAALEDTLNGVP